jgi:hypothetical protein
MVDAEDLGDVFKSGKDERYLFSKQLTLNPRAFVFFTTAQIQLFDANGKTAMLNKSRP